jgi:long-chain acyl-CoA synthetase
VAVETQFVHANVKGRSLYPGTYAVTTPTKAAAVLAETGETLTYSELDERSIRLAHALRDNGLRRGDVVILLSENNLHAFEVYWAAVRSGLYFTAVNHSLGLEEVSFIVNDSGAKALVASAAKRDTAGGILPDIDVPLRLAFDGPIDGYCCYEDALRAASRAPLAAQPHGRAMLYSSGTTGRPKGVQPPLPDCEVDSPADPNVALQGKYFGVDQSTIYLSPAPLYHAAPLRWSAGIQAHGGTVVVMRKFDAQRRLETIEKYRVTHAQFVPTMFIRMLDLPDARRKAYDLSTLRAAIHAAAPCPVTVKQRMIDFWGPIVYEYYAGTEGNGMTMIDSRDCLRKPGSVGRPLLGTIRICDDTGELLGPAEVGDVYFERDITPFVYLNDPDKTAKSQHPQHPNWSTLGDIGYLDDDGFLFLTDRKSFTIISGGVNIYPAEIESVLALHPAVADVAVFGVPDAEMGEAVMAVVQPAAGAETDTLADELAGFVRSKIAPFKVPRKFDFSDQLPRSDTGKMMKAELKHNYSNGT